MKYNDLHHISKYLGEYELSYLEDPVFFNLFFFDLDLDPENYINSVTSLRKNFNDGIDLTDIFNINISLIINTLNERYKFRNIRKYKIKGYCDNFLSNCSSCDMKGHHNNVERCKHFISSGSCSVVH